MRLLAAPPQPTRQVAAATSPQWTPHVLAQLQCCSLDRQPRCTSVWSHLPAQCWSDRLCVEQRSASSAPAVLTQTEPFKHAFELLCNCVLPGSVDVLCALLPHVTDVAALQRARKPTQRMLESLFMCAPHRTEGLPAELITHVLAKCALLLSRTSRARGGIACRATLDEHSLYRCQRQLHWRAADVAQLHASPSGAPLALVEQLLVYPPAFASACGAFVWGSVGYVQMTLECLRLLCYVVLGYVLPAWLLQQDSLVGHVAGGVWRTCKPLAAIVGDAAAEDLPMGTDPGLWALRQVFRSSWQRFSAAADAPLGAAACLRCGPQRPAELRDAAASLRSELLGADGESEAERPHATALPAPVLVVTGAAAAGASRDDSHASWELSPGVHAIVHDSARGGARLHDQVSADYRGCLDRCMRDVVAVDADQVTRLGTFRAADVLHAEGEQGSGGRHVDLVRGAWGGEVAAGALKRELMTRQGTQGIVPGRLGALPAFYVVPALVCTPTLLAAGCEALQVCLRRRIWAGDHV